MKVHDSAGVSIPFRLDPLSKTRLEWIKAQCPTIKPTGSLILRRALAHYTDYLERTISDPKKMERELIMLKACASGDSVPWKTPPAFESFPGKPLGEFIREAGKRQIERFLASSPFEHKARCMGGIK